MSEVTKNLKTRGRILAVALKLFNEQGESNVTTAQIAKHLGISEGNLWYHFRTKRDLIMALYEMLEAEIDRNLSRLPQENAALCDHLQYTARAFEYLWEFRFLFRDRFNNLASESFDLQMQALIRRGQENVVRILRDMSRCGMLTITPEAANALAINAWIVHSNWLSYLQARENINVITEAHIKEGFAQMMWLFDSYWSDEARREAEKLLANFTLAKD